MQKVEKKRNVYQQDYNLQHIDKHQFVNAEKNIGQKKRIPNVYLFTLTGTTMVRKYGLLDSISRKLLWLKDTR